MSARISRDEQIRRMTEKHEGFYTYENWGWPTSHKKSWVTCPIHGDFETTFRRHTNKGAGCPECGRKKIAESNVERWQNNVEYRKKMTAMSNERCQDPEFRKAQSERMRKSWQDPETRARRLESFSLNSGEPSLDVLRMVSMLKYLGVDYQGGENTDDEFTIPGTAYRFDFYLPDYNLFIEYHGKQHYEYVEFFHKTPEGFKKKQRNDKRKAQWAEDNGYGLLVIPYWDAENIEPILAEALGF